MTDHSAVAVAPACLRLLGGWQLLVDGSPVALGHREQRLTALLGLTDLTVRAQVASVLWPDSTDEHALGSLRRAVRQCHTSSPGLVVAARQTARLDPAVRVDVDDLRRAAGLTRLPMTDHAARELLDALRGPELLPGWFDDWVVDERGRLERLRVEALEQVARHGLRHDDFALAVEASGVASGIDPLRESAREMSIRGHLGLGDAASAAHELQRYAAVMGEELGVAPPDRIRALLGPVDEPARRTRPVSVPAEPVAARLVGAEEELVPPGPPMGLDEWLDGKPPGGARQFGAALVGVTGVALLVTSAVALVVVVGGPDRPPQATTDPGGGTSLVAPPADGPGTVARATGTVRVRLVESGGGSAAFAVRATPVPTEVRLVVRGRAGVRVVRHVVLRRAGGRQVVVEGLDPGTYRWSATADAAGHVGGEVSVTPPPAEDRDVGGSAPSATTVPVTGPPAPTGTPTARPTPTPTPIPTPTPTPTPIPTPTPSSTPTASHTPRPTPSSPTGTPSDPGTVAPTPVG